MISFLVAAAIVAAGFWFGHANLNFSSASSQNKNLPSQLNYSSVNQVYQDLRSQYDGKLTNSQLLNGLKGGLTQATGDPYTEYFNAAQAKQLNNELNDTFGGIGAQLKVSSNNSIQVVEPLPGTPALAAGPPTAARA